MTVTIKSLLGSGPLTVPLATGTAVRLGPGEQSPELPDAEVSGNSKIDKLCSRRLIEVVRIDAAEPEVSDDSDAETAQAGTGKSARHRATA
ncbi:hypothetical protein [Nocardia gipuzkoensis]|uniref:hypothetical protein n=1 Tax=Nocardia gipuzkoensis TaxID=2749991 RepID=UPI003EE1266C